MARYIPDRNGDATIEAARQWVEDCLVNDSSMFREEALWTVDNLQALDEWFIQRPDGGKGTFYEKLEGQLSEAPPAARRLMAEVIWALFLFPSNINVGTKCNGIQRVWGWSGDELAADHPLLSEAIIQGIGSGGPGINNYRWRELVFIINLAMTCKRLAEPQRRKVFRDYERFVDWIPSVPVDGKRQFRHMLRYFLFTDRVERMSANSDRRKVLLGFKRGDKRQIRKLSDVELDSALLALRQELERKYDTTELDFYAPPLRGNWKAENEDDAGGDDEADLETFAIQEPGGEYRQNVIKPRNVILYGPPGTGKTRHLQQLFPQYTDQPADVERSSWEQELLTEYGWRPVIAAALADLGEPVRVQRLVEHPLVKAKALQRDRKGDIRPQMWSYLQEHTPPSVSTVQVAQRREPGIFTKNDDSEWSLLQDWRDRDGDAADLSEKWSRGPAGTVGPVRRYRMVTFHPSYSYEDFIVGLRPVETGATNGAASQTSFQMVPGIFKQLCSLAKANPAKRYALFIDEINRANIAKVFGELITLIEPDKRARYGETGRLEAGIEAHLPGLDGEEARFGVPENLDIFGTMNTADRSIALLDIALRRRFEFEEMPPLYQTLERFVDGVHLANLLRVINDRLECLLDRDHRIGHAYFIRIRQLEDLRSVFAKQVIPLLQEYFFDDWSRIVLVLSHRNGKSPFIRQTRMDVASLFGTSMDKIGERQSFEVTRPDSWSVVDFQSIYQSEPPAPVVG